MVRRFTGIFGLLAALLTGCGSAADSRDEVNFFDPHEYGDYERRIPSGERNSDRYPWTDIEENIVFHTLEESEATKNRWQPLYSQLEAERHLVRGRQTWGWSVTVVTRLDQDTQAQRLNPEMLSHRGGFYGLGEPMRQSKLHMFECTGEAQEAVYLFGEILVECKGDEGLVFHFPVVETEDTREYPEPRIAPRWYQWWTEIFSQAQEEVWIGGDFGGFLPVNIFIYASQEDVGVNAVRQLAITSFHHSTMRPDPENIIYSDPITEVPPEYCTYQLNARGQCKTPH